MEIGYIGLGKMGLAMVSRLLEKKWRVVAWNRSMEPRDEARKLGAVTSDTIEGVCQMIPSPRLFWVMVSHGVVGEVLKDMLPFLSEGDTVIDGGNSFFRKSQARSLELAHRGIHFLDVGVSGGPEGARRGACLMIGGRREVFETYESLFKDLSLPNGYAYLGKSGAGHFVKMVHNGIEYGMMQALGEGFHILKQSEFNLPLQKIAELYNRGSVIESRLVGWLARAFKEHGEGLKDISGEVAHSGEGEWTVETAQELGVPVDIIEKSLEFRLKSKGNPSFTGQVVSALRNQFGGHDVSLHEEPRREKN